MNATSHSKSSRHSTPTIATDLEKNRKKIHEAFNKRFFDPESNTCRSRTHCSCVLPLAFGLVPQANCRAVTSNLVREIMVRRHRHVWMGLVGMGWAMRKLNYIGRAEVAYAVATQTTRPSWAYMVAKSASGVWERWDQDTQGPGMNGRGFLTLAGDLNAWSYQGLAGVNPDPERPVFKQVILRPRPVGDLEYVRRFAKRPAVQPASGGQRNRPGGS